MNLRRLSTVPIPGGERLFTAYTKEYWPALFNDSGFGASRFSPLESNGAMVPTVYCARNATVALLETAFHDLHETGERFIYEGSQLRRRGLAMLTTPERMVLVDLTDGGLDRIGLRREQLVSTAPQHYACTREWASALHERRVGRATPVGLIWQSRIAELAGRDSPLLKDLLALGDRVCLLFGDRLPTTPAAWRPGDPMFDDLTAGEGRLLVEAIAEQLGAEIVPN